MAMRVLAPGKDVSWIQKPNGVTIYALLPKSQKLVRVPSCETLFAWGLTMMKGAALLPDVTARLLAYRDGLLITLLASRGRRRRSLSLLTIGREIFKEGDHYRIELAPHQVKTKPDRFDIGGSLTASLDHYLGIVRPALLGDSGHESFWVGQSGRPLTLKGLTQRLHVLSRQRFGYSFGPHAFRHALSTMLAEHDPHTSGLAAAVLGISPAVNMAHYNRAKQRGPLIKFALLIDQRKAALAGRCGR